MGNSPAERRIANMGLFNLGDNNFGMANAATSTRALPPATTTSAWFNTGNNNVGIG